MKSAGEAGARLPARWLPESVCLLAVGEDWPVDYRAGNGRRVSASERGRVLVVSGAIRDPWACRAALQRWLARRAALDLGSRLEGVSASTGLFYERVRIANQRTRWASCSRMGTISLNQKLMLLPEHLVDYVFIHELCHTVFLDHSRRFWGLVRAWRPEFRQLERELRRDAPRYVPAWC